MKLESFLDVPDTPRFYALVAVMILELMPLGALENYAKRPETLPATVVPCRHTNTLCEPLPVQSSMPSPGEPYAADSTHNNAVAAIA